jgi:hypothetical protein
MEGEATTTVPARPTLGGHEVQSRVAAPLSGHYSGLVDATSSSTKYWEDEEEM